MTPRQCRSKFILVVITTFNCIIFLTLTVLPCGQMEGMGCYEYFVKRRHCTDESTVPEIVLFLKYTWEGDQNNHIRHTLRILLKTFLFVHSVM